MAEVVGLPDRVPSLGAGTALCDVTPEGLRVVLEQRWGNAAATWNSRSIWLCRL